MYNFFSSDIVLPENAELRGCFGLRKTQTQDKPTHGLCVSVPSVNELWFMTSVEPDSRSVSQAVPHAVPRFANPRILPSGL